MFRKALELHPTYVEAHFNLGWFSSPCIRHTHYHAWMHAFLQLALSLLVIYLEIESNQHSCCFSSWVLALKGIPFEVEIIPCRLSNK